jgi:class 3 adenylate cyclase
LVVNQGLAEGREWFGAFQTAGSFKFVALGDATARAVRFATCAQGGAVLAAKSVLAALPAALQAQVRFGTRRGDAAGQVTVPGAYATLASLSGLAEPLPAEDATLAVTEVFDLIEQSATPAGS